jgi:hypothetical protein
MTDSPSVLDARAQEPLAVSVCRAAELVGVSRAQFYKKWVNAGLVPLIDLGARGKSVRVADLRAVVAAKQPAA